MTVWLSRVRWRLAIWVPGIGLVWVGRAGHVTPALTVGAAVLLVSVLPWPWTAEKYRNRAFRIGNRWAETVVVAHRQFQRAHEQRRSKLALLTAPNQFADTHDRLLSLEVKPLANKHRPLVERTQKWIERQAGFERDLAALRARASNGERNAYVSQIDIRLSDSKNDYARMAAETERALSKAIEQIEHLHIPSKLATQHAELRHAYCDHLSHGISITKEYRHPISTLRSALSLTLKQQQQRSIVATPLSIMRHAAGPKLHGRRKQSADEKYGRAERSARS